MKKRLLFCIAVLLSGIMTGVSGQRRAGAKRAVVPSLDRIVKEAFQKEFGVTGAEAESYTWPDLAYRVIVNSGVLRLIDSKTRPDTIYLKFPIASEGGLPMVSVWQKDKAGYVIYDDFENKPTAEWVEKHGWKDAEWYYTNKYLILNFTDLREKPMRDEELTDAIYSWNAKAFKDYLRGIMMWGIDGEYFLRIIRSRSGYSFDSMRGLYKNSRVRYKTTKTLYWLYPFPVD